MLRLKKSLKRLVSLIRAVFHGLKLRLPVLQQVDSGGAKACDQLLLQTGEVQISKAMPSQSGINAATISVRKVCQNVRLLRNVEYS
ncbi:MAG: hypothetical protein IPL58_14795 [Betaproteobacteria bacterium]|uniref:Uncharacterized protein n=1 Tax=Candidatus Proximibacter danicus TaxID=2954365 RepID=A0A9D7K2T6_9PROT|nr:hypothetical protein [Candidatus Proximibacter danicus]